ncbi:MAG: hypothetical protein KA746_08055 [Pyrinomonadaceae bacterium]|nr:hypothetical protein [Pyrinomonadaceae bacterium]MBP6213250.1 hypothetical protein [Pyrinomonadaceae bacterium]
MNDDLQQIFDTVSAEMFSQCHENAPNFGVTAERFQASLSKTTEKYLISASPETATESELREFLALIQADDLFMALACSDGNERAWWEFDQHNRSYMERVARHLAKTEMDADEVIDWVYGELYGTRVVDGERVSKFATYSGRGSMRGWLRTVIWHSLVDMHRASHDEVSLDEMTENIGDGAAHANFAVAPSGGESAMLDQLTQDRYRRATVSSLSAAFASLDDHERLLLMYYHVDSMKLREISRLVENPDSPLRGWFQRRSQTREKDPNARIHESTVMRWLEKSYARVLELFRSELTGSHGLSTDEVEICMDLATRDLAGGDIFRGLAAK